MYNNGNSSHTPPSSAHVNCYKLFCISPVFSHASVVKKNGINIFETQRTLRTLRGR